MTQPHVDEKEAFPGDDCGTGAGAREIRQWRAGAAENHVERPVGEPVLAISLEHLFGAAFDQPLLEAVTRGGCEHYETDESER